MFLHPILIGDQQPQASLDPVVLPLLVSLVSYSGSGFNPQSALQINLVAYSSLSPGTHGRATFLGFSSHTASRQEPELKVFASSAAGEIAGWKEASLLLFS